MGLVLTKGTIILGYSIACYKFDELDFFLVCIGVFFLLLPVKFKFEIDKKSSSPNLIFQTGELQKSRSDR